MKWRETKGKEPECLDDYDYVWIYSRNFGMAIKSTSSFINWYPISHWQPADIKEPASPQLVS